MKKVVTAYLLVLITFTANTQNLDSLLNTVSGPENNKVFATFKANRIVNIQSIETVKSGTLDFSIAHRFGNMGGASNGGVHTLWGLDNSDDIRISFDYGVTENLQLGLARSKRNEDINGLAKWRFLTQTTTNKIPFSAVLYSSAAFTPVKEDLLYAGVDSSAVKKMSHRFNYCTQLLLARKFNWRLSLELFASYHHRNFVKAYVNPSNNAVDKNGIFSIGLGGRFKFTRRAGIVFDYVYNFSEFRTDNKLYPHYNPLGIGIEIETGGHVFTITFSNSKGIIENDFIPNTTDEWLKGGFKIGFNISRVFTIVKPK